jgi:hypothetical protein
MHSSYVLLYGVHLSGSSGKIYHVLQLDNWRYFHALQQYSATAVDFASIMHLLAQPGKNTTPEISSTKF